MADGAPNLNLTPEEKRVFYQLFQAADTTNLGVVTGETAVSFFEKTSLAPDTLGLIWQIADTQNRGLLTPSGFSVVLRLIGHAQAGRAPTEELALQPAPLPKFTGISDTLPSKPVEPAGAASPPPGAVRVPPLNPDEVNKFANLFEKSDVQNGLVSGEIAKQIFQRARLPNEVLGRIWNLADTKQRGALDSTEFVIAMHLLTSYKTGTMRGIPQTLPAGFYEAAARRGVARHSTGPRSGPEVPPVPAIPKQFSGTGPQRVQSPLARGQFASPLSSQSTGNDWLVTPQEKAQFDSIFATVDKSHSGFINGDQAVGFFSNAQLPEEVLAQIWDLADIDSDGQLSRDEFSVAMYLVRSQRSRKEPLPQAIPPALVPPSMRRQQPALAPAASPVPKAPVPRSAAEDLFGLDAFSAPDSAPVPAPVAPSQIPQSTGGSQGPFHTPSSPSARASPVGPSTTFRPFIPSSSFGQSLNPQYTGLSNASQPRSPPSAADDLLGDNDPEESNKLTNETTELANLSNQIGSLSRELQNVQVKRSSAEQELSQNSQQKRDFEARLAQARTMYEQEVKDFKALEERLQASRSETRKLQQDYALVEGGRQDLHNQYTQAATALEADQRENASLKEKIREANAEVSQLKARLEKARSEGRQQKGLVAINKKQLATVEGEQGRIQGEIDSIAAEPPQERSFSPQAGVTSPAASTASQNTNPFFRRTATGSSDNVMPPQAPSDPHSAFDSVFGPSFTAPTTATPPPSTSFRTESPVVPTVSTPQPQTSDESGAATPSASSPPSTLGRPSSANEPPPPPQSRQFTPTFLPLRDENQSATSSTKVSPPASRYGAPGDITPIPSFPEAGVDDKSATTSRAASAAETRDISSPAPLPAAAAGAAVATAGEAQNKPDAEVPGAFPQPPSGVPSPSNDKPAEESFDDLFGGPARQRSQSQKAMDFEEAFASMKPHDHSQGAEFPQANGQHSAETGEFPPIRELDDDDSSSDSEAEMGFDDNFSPASPPRKESKATADEASTAFPPIETITSPPPAEDSQKSPPQYTGGSQTGSNDFPKEFNGLLPDRSDPTSPPQAPNAVESSTGAPIVHNEPQHEAGAVPKIPGPADFESAFAGMNLAPAAEAEDDDEDDDTDSQPNKFSTDFDMTFDSPSQPKSTAGANAASGNNTGNFDFFNFDANPATTSGASPFESSATSAGPAQPVNAPSVSHDWDALFANLDGPKVTDDSNGADANAGPAESANAPSAALAQSKPPGWALSADTGEDDLILQRLTGMGYPRDESLAALEKFDYNIDKAADFLTSKS